MIIYGTGNFHKRNHAVVRGQCPHCGKIGYKSSFDTTRFFTLYFLPIIPIGRHRILMDCKACDKNWAISLSEWKKIQRIDLPAALAQYEKNRENRETVIGLINLIVQAQATEHLEKIGPQIRNTFPQDEEILTLLAAAYSRLCLDEKAGSLYLSLLDITDDEEVTRQAENHRKLTGLTPPSPPNAFLQRIPLLITPGIILFLLLAVLVPAFQGSKIATHIYKEIENVYLVNGLDYAYSVSLDGQKYVLKPGHPLLVPDIEYGTHTVTPSEASGIADPITWTYTSDDIRGSRYDNAVVINPDASAILIWQNIAYSDPPPAEDTSKLKIFTGKDYYTYSHIDYVFEDFPEEIQLPSSNSVVRKTGLFAVEDTSPMVALQFLQYYDNMDLYSDYIEQRVLYPSEFPHLQSLAANFMEPEAFKALAAGKVRQYPIEIEWHRNYHDMLADESQRNALEQHYRDLLVQHPDDPALMYVLGRISDDPREAEQLFLTAAESPQDQGYGAFALSYNYNLDGKFEAAERYAKLALEKQPENYSFDRQLHTTAMRAQDYDLLIERLQDGYEQDLLGVDYAAHYIEALWLSGKQSEARIALTKTIARLQSSEDISEEEKQANCSYLNTRYHLTTQDRTSLLATIRSNSKNDPSWAFMDALFNKNLQEASDLLQETNEGFGINDHLALYLAFNNSQSARQHTQQHLESAIACLDCSKHTARHWSEWLSGQATPSPEEVLHNLLPEGDGYLLMETLSKLYPQDGAAYHELALRLRDPESLYAQGVDDI